MDVAANPVQRPPAAPAASRSSAPAVNCTCRYAGRDYQIGENACIRGSLATCSTILNNTSWSVSGAPCPMTHFAPSPSASRG